MIFLIDCGAEAMPGKSVSIWIEESLYRVIEKIVRETGLNRSTVINALLYKALIDMGVEVDQTSFQGALATIKYYVERGALSGRS